MKKKLAATLSVVLILGLAVLGILAYLTDTDSDVNVMELGNVDITQYEKDANGNVFEQDQPLYPNTSVDKVVTVENTGKSDAFVRTWFAFEAPMTHITPAWAPGVVPPTDYTEVEIDGQKFMVCCVTYSEALKKGEVVGSLVSVAMSKDATNEDMVALGDDQEYKILVYSQAVQTEGFKTAQDALNTAFGSTHPWEGFAMVSNSAELEEAIAAGNTQIFLAKGTYTVPNVAKGKKLTRISEKR